MPHDDDELILIRDGVSLRPDPDVWARCDTVVMTLADKDPRLRDFLRGLLGLGRRRRV